MKYRKINITIIHVDSENKFRIIATVWLTLILK